MNEICAIGLMSGTSMDGIDIASLVTDGENRVSRGLSLFMPYEAGFRRRIEAGLKDAASIRRRDERPGGLAALEREITQRHAEAVGRFTARHAGMRPRLVGFHGQTVLHRPGEALTVQLGLGGLLADLIGLPVVWDMRAADMREGGQGAPLVPAYHAALAHGLPERFSGAFPVVFVNIGGISNVTFVPRTGDPVAFDSGPGNALIDRWVAREAGVPFDDNGVIASEGRVAEQVVRRYLDNPFFVRTGAKSLDRSDFSLEPAAGLDLADGARTLAAVSARAILKAAEHMPAAPKLWIICGGGRKNPAVLGELRQGAAREGAEVILAEEAGFDGDSMEAEAWAYLAVRSTRKLPLTFPATTGCRVPTTGGVLSRPGEGKGPI